MYQRDADVIFPIRVLESLTALRGERWQDLVNQVKQAPQAALEQQAFTLMMVHLNSCMTCSAHSHRAFRGCTDCSQSSLRRFKGSDDALVHKYQQAMQDVQAWHASGAVPPEVDRSA